MVAICIGFAKRKLRPSVMPAYGGSQWLFLRAKPKSLGPRVRKGDERGGIAGPRMRKSEGAGALANGQVKLADGFDLNVGALMQGFIKAGKLVIEQFWL